MNTYFKQLRLERQIVGATAAGPPTLMWQSPWSMSSEVVWIKNLFEICKIRYDPYIF